jgi:acetyl esterase/lipase
VVFGNLIFEFEAGSGHSVNMQSHPEYQGPNPEWDQLLGSTEIPGFNNKITPLQLRQAANDGRVKASQATLDSSGLREKVTHRDYSILTRDSQNIIGRLYLPKTSPSPPTRLPVFLYFHGGGHLNGNVDAEDSMCYGLVANTNIAVLHVNCRHTPEFGHPTQANDAVDGFAWLVANGESLGLDTFSIVVGGISAGGMLAAWISYHHVQETRADPTATLQKRIKGQVLGTPWLIHPDNHPASKASTPDPNSSYVQNANAPVLPLPALRLFADCLKAEDPTDLILTLPFASDEKLRGTPKSSVIVAGMDILRDEGLHYAKRLQDLG